MRQKRAALTLLSASVLLAAPLLFGILRSGAAANTDSLLGYWKFEESLVSDAKVDYSGDSHTGSPSGTVLPQYSNDTPPTNYANGKSLVFGNTNNAVNIASTAALDDLPNLSVSAWIYPTSYAGESAQGRIIDKTNSVNGWSFYVDNGALHFYANFSTSALRRVTTATLPLDTWAHVAVAWDGTADSSGVQLYIDGVEQTTFSTDVSGEGSRISDNSYGIIIGNNSALNRSFAGNIDEVRLYNRQLLGSEVSDMANGNHPTATWTGAVSSDYETAGNWNIGAIPDPYAHVRIAPSVNQPVTSTHITLGELTIDAGARLNVLNHNVTMNDGGAFHNNGTLQLRNAQVFSGFANDTDSGTVLITPVGDTAGLKTGDAYHNLIINDSTFAHWPLDENNGTVAADISGYERHADYSDEPTPSTDRPETNFTNSHSLEFDGIDDALAFDDQTMPENATWCAWANLAAGDGVILGAAVPGQYALAVFENGTEVRAYNQADGQQASWEVDSVYGSWKHFCITQTDLGVTHALALYIDGESQGGSETLLEGAGLINRIGTDSNVYFEGLIDDVRIYSRVLTGGEINAMVAGNMPATSLYRTSLGAAAAVNGDLVINSGIFDVTTSNYALNIAGNFDNNGGVFQGRSGTVTLTGGDQRIKSSTTFYNLTKNVTSAATLKFGKGSLTTVTNQLTLTGAEGELLSLRSSEDGVQWFLNPAGSETVNYLDVMDSHNIDPYPVDITNSNTVDSGNNTNWTINVPPNAPINLGGANYIGGGFVGDSTPTLSFELSDTNPADLLRYRIQIDDDSDFLSPIVDYTSDAAAQGARSFTVGQNLTDDTYTIGSDGMALPTGDYYWRVKTIDNYVSPNESEYTAANDGAVAFRLDVTPPTNPGQPETESSQTNKTPTWTWEASEDYESGLGSPTYTLQWSKDETFATLSSNTTSNTSFTHGSNLTDGYWYFRVQAVDAMGNTSEWSVSEPHLIDTTGPDTPVAPYTSSPTNFNQPTWSWSPPVDAGIGLADVPYTVQWSDGSNFPAETTNEETVAANNFPHPEVLTDGTWYFRVRAADKLGNLSAWSATSSVLIDTSPPSLPGQPYTINNPTNNKTPSWSWDPSIDAGVGLTPTPYTIQWSAFGDFTNIAGSTTSATNSFTHGGELTDGTWYIRINARDQLGNQSAYSPAGQVTIDTVAPDTPAAPSTTSPTNDDTPTWSWPVPDDVGVGLADTPYEVEWSSDSEFSSIEGSAMADTNSFTHDTSLAEGMWYFRVRATDAAGNTSDFSDGGEVEIDVTPPTTPGDPSTSDPINEDKPTWSWLVSTDSGVGLATDAYELQWSQDEDFDSEVFSDTAAANEFTHTDPLPDGTWHIRIRAVDAVGNRSEWSGLGSKTVDIEPPTIPGQPATETPTANNMPTWTWTESTDAGMGLHDLPYMIEWSQDELFESGVVHTDTIAANEFTHTDPLADGAWYFRVRAADDVGNISDYSPVGETVVDATAPSTPGAPATTSPTNNDRPTWTWSASSDGAGTGLATDAYELQWSQDEDFDSEVFSDTAAANEFTHTDPLPDGTWHIRIRAVDAVGNRSEWSDGGSVEVDDTPPSIPGAPGTATPTNDNKPTWTWSASSDNGVGPRDPFYDVQWSQDEDFDDGGMYSVQISDEQFTHTDPLADGTWYFRVRAVDALLNTSDYSPVGSVLIATAGPSIPGQPAAPTPTTDTTPTWTWDPSSVAEGLGNPTYHLEWSTDSDFLINVQTHSTQNTSFTHTDNLDDGVWYLRLRAEDDTNVFSLYSSVGMVHVDTTAPTIPDDVVSSTPTSNRTPTWTWEESVDDGVGLDDPAYEIQWSQDDEFFDGVSEAATSSPEFTHLDDLADGVWWIRIRAVDALGNISSYSEPASVHVDATAPTPPGRPSTTTPTADSTPTWTWEESVDDGVGLDDPAYEIQWSQNSSFASVSSTSTNSTSLTHASALADGTWYIRIRAADKVGNISSWSLQGEVIIDSSAPTAPGTPSAGAEATNNTTPTWTWEESTDSGVGLGDPAYQVQWSQDNEFLDGISSGTAGSASFTHSTELPEGTWYFRVRAVDGVNNTSGWSGSGEVYIDTDAPSAPGTPSTDVSPTNNRTPQWTWDPSSDDGFGFGDEPYQLQWSQDGSFSSDVQSADHDSESFTHSTALTDGTWHFRVRARDSAGNTSSWSSPGSVVIDATPPSLPANLATDTPTKNPTPTWTWEESVDDGVGLDDPAYEIQWSTSSSFQDTQSATTNDPVFTHIEELGFGEWYFRVRAVDAIGNTSAWVSQMVSIDNTPPVISGITVTPGSAGAVITWTTNEVASSRVLYGAGSVLTESTAESNTDPRVTSHRVVLQNLSACTTYQYQIASIDLLENEGFSSQGGFTTTACSGNAAIMTQDRAVVGASGGQVNLNSGSAAARIVVSAGAVSNDTDFQIKQLSPAAALAGIGQPAGYALVGNHVYDLKALHENTTIIRNFDGSLSVTMTYTAAEISGFIPSSLAIFRHDGSSWRQLDGCTVNAAARQVTCQTSAFSVFGLFGTRQAPSPPLPVGNGTIEPDPLPETKPLPEQKGSEQPEGQTETASDQRGLSATVTRAVRTVINRPVWWGSLLLLATSVGTLFYLKRIRPTAKNRQPYGIHKDE